jgi:nitrate reductase NapE component
MGAVFAVAGLALICVMLLDGFEAMVLPRRVTHPYRLARLFYRGTWALWRSVSRRLPPGKRQQTFLSLFGPLSLLGLFATWVVGLVVGFGVLHWSLGTPLNGPPGEQPGLSTYLYLSGTTFFTLGYGDVTPAGPFGRVLAVAESGLGFGFMAVIIGYLPVLYQAFSRREVTISLLDARAGSPPSAAQFLLRLARTERVDAADPFLAEWERWSAELLESHLSFPVLSYYRSQHDNQSWLAALTAVLDSCAFLIAGVKGAVPYQAQLTFAMARHAAVDLALVFRTPPQAPDPDRLPAGELLRLRAMLREAGLPLPDGEAFDQKLAGLRALYEPFVNALAQLFLFRLPPVVPEKETVDNWQTSAWTRRSPGIDRLPAVDGDEHFD